MKQLHANRHALNFADFKMRSAQEGDYDTLITESTAVYEDGELKAVYLETDIDCTAVLRALNTIKYESNTRTDGLPTKSRIFGFSPRNTIRKDFCSATGLAKESPREHAAICEYGTRIAEYYRSMNPNLYDRHNGLTLDNVMGDYRIKDTPFTSGIINKNNPLKYHFDTGNFRDVWSCMPVFKHRVEGGYLSVPEYGLAFELKHNSVFMFDGQGLMHGVTPIRRLSADAWRYSIVYYSLREMWNCLPITDELVRIRNKKTEREVKRTQERSKEVFKR